MDAIEVIRQLETDPGLRAQLRSVLLGDEFLTVPELTAQNTTAIGTLVERVAQLAEQTAENTRAIGALTEQTAENTRAIAALREETAENTRAIAALTEQMAQLTGRVDREVSRVDQIIGTLMERQVIGKFELVLDEEGIEYKSCEATSGVRFVSDGKHLDKLNRKSPFAKDELNRLKRTDVVALVRRENGSSFTAVAEVSYAVGTDDVSRAAASARILASRGIETRAFAIGRAITGRTQELARQEGVKIIVGDF